LLEYAKVDRFDRSVSCLDDNQITTATKRRYGRTVEVRSLIINGA